MLAAWYVRQGAAHEVLQIGEQPDPEPGPDEVRVRVSYSGVIRVTPRNAVDGWDRPCRIREPFHAVTEPGS
jgi:threonine dehydrogenase-like Zn-dependent dehydrogenase